MNELEAAKIMIGGLLQSGTVTDPAELRFLKQRLEELEKRQALSGRRRGCRDSDASGLKSIS
jgi:hypothetical protein